MTRFNTSITDGIEMVMYALKNMHEEKYSFKKQKVIKFLI